MVGANLIPFIAVLAKRKFTCKSKFHRLNRNTIQPMLTDTHHPWVDPWVDNKALRSTPTED